MPQHAYEGGKVGDDLPLQISLTNADGSACPIESAHITIVNEKGQRVVNEELASQISASVAQYMFTPARPSKYIVEWHLVYGGGLDKFVHDIELPISQRRAL